MREGSVSVPLRLCGGANIALRAAHFGLLVPGLIFFACS
jgi:hypothetical protein